MCREDEHSGTVELERWSVTGLNFSNPLMKNAKAKQWAELLKTKMRRPEKTALQHF